MTTENNIDIELLVSLVESRPVIWDKTLETYNNKDLKTAAWREICVELNDGFDQMEDDKRHDYAKKVIKKWINMRDNWLRSEKTKTSEATPVTSKICHHQLMFLKKIASPAPAPAHDRATTSATADATLDSTTTQNSIETVINNNNQQEDANPSEVVEPESTVDENLNKNIELKVNDVDKKLPAFIDRTVKNEIDKNAEDRNLLFFRSLLPSLTTLNDDLVLEFYSGVLNLLRNIKGKSKLSPAGHSLTEMQNCTPQKMPHGQAVGPSAHRGYFTPQVRASQSYVQPSSSSSESQTNLADASYLPHFDIM